MLGARDAVGNLLILADRFIDALGIPVIKDAVKRLRNSLYDFILESAFGLTTGELKEYLGRPQTQFDPVMTNDAFFTEGGTKISRADFDSKELRLSGATFEYEKVPAAYNTVVLTKLLLMGPSEVNRLMHDLSSHETLDHPSAILGFARTLDGSN